MSNYEWNVDSYWQSDYVTACKEFVTNDSKFKNFKQDSRYKIILEHISKEESDLFISEMKDSQTLTEEQLKEFRENDLYGNPELHEYDFFGKMSPSTIRYIKNALDIFNFVGNKKIKDIVEIGGGYGGLCKTMSVLFDYDNYVLIDLPEVNALSKKYTDQFSKLNGKVSQLSFNELDKIENIDLVISNYAFSECSYSAQMKYYDDVVANSEYFYMVYNNITPGNMDSTKFLELASGKFHIDVEEEIRFNHKNYIYYASKNKPSKFKLKSSFTSN